MTYRIWLALFVLLADILSACATAPPQPAEEMIKPGDKIGDFLITTGKEGEVLYPFDLSRSCASQGENGTFTCKSSVGKQVNVTTGLYDDTVRSTTPTAKLNELWAASNYKLFINERPVNLPAFGYVETQHPIKGVIRFWNVAVVADKPGEITVRDSGIAHGDPFGDTTTYAFSAP